jgi:membrane-bound lytic murein transglycosylase F
MNECRRSIELRLFMKKTLFIIFTAYLLAGCDDVTLSYERIIASGELRFATVESPATYYINNHGPAGFEFELAKRFTSKIGVKLKPVIAQNSEEVVSLVANNKASIGGAALQISLNTEDLMFGPSYYSVPLQLVYRRGNVNPKHFADMNVEIPFITSYQMRILKNEYPNISWKFYHRKKVNNLLWMVHDNKINSTIADYHFVNIYKHLYPDIRVAFDVTQAHPVAWLYKRDDEKLNTEIISFFNEMNSSGELNTIVEYYFGHLVAFDYVDTISFLTRFDKRLLQYRKLFIETANKYNLDWTLLAAISYQESHWDPYARSPTGVRGLMMLTQETAKYLNVGNRLDPAQSIDGGARYFRLMLEKIPDRIKEPDRTWLALAAYNIGYQYLESARVFTEASGGDPDCWKDIKKSLLLLADKSNSTKPDSIRIRWNEPVRYVRNIRKYNDIIKWLTASNIDNYKRPESHGALDINSPVL